MRLSGRAWLLVLLVVGFTGFLAVKTRPRIAPSPAYVDRGREPPGLEPKPVHSLRSEETADGERFWVRNLIQGPIETRCQFETSENVVASPDLPRDLVLAAGAEVELTTLMPAGAVGASRASIQCSAMVGDPGAPAPADVAYALPFYPGTAFVLGQGFNGRFSHNDAQSRYAVDLDVPEGTPVVAARAGVVMEVENDFHGHGVDLGAFGDRANYVRVLHDDGSMAVYAHLAPGTALVRSGDRVKVGEFLARSGNTGFTTGPHLHFVVQRNIGLALDSIPFRMAGVVPAPGS